MFDEMSTGAADDLAKATEIARSMVVRFGMDRNLGQVAYEPESASLLGAPGGVDWHPHRYGEETAAAIDTAVRGLVDAAFQKAFAILTANHVLLDQAAKDLLAKETFSAEDLQGISTKVAPPAVAEKTPKVGIGLAAASRGTS